MEKCISESLLFQYLINELDADKNDIIREHLAQCTSCQKKLETFSEDGELRKWHECHQRQQSDDSSQNQPISQDKLDELYNSTISSLLESKTQEPKSNPASDVTPPSQHDFNLSLGKDLNLNPIKTIGKYQVIKIIGQGGMGVVYLAIHTHLKKQVVLKLLLNKDWDNANQTQRFYREMELVGQLDHPNIVKATDAGEADGAGFLVMEYLVGHDLKTILKSEGPVSITAACTITRQVANGLQYIHNNKLIHRDIKPSNLFLTTDGQIKILDLGLAGLSHSESSISDLTDSNCIMGSANYISPEQAQGIKFVDHRSDIYSLGCTFYQLLTGQVPFRKKTLVETIIAHREEPAPQLSDHLPEIPQELKDLFQSMIKKDPAERIQTMAEVVKKLDNFLTNNSNLPLNDASDTYLTESQELKQLCCTVSLTPAVEALNQFPTTQYQTPPRFFNKYKTILLVSLVVLLTAGTGGFFLLPETLPDPPSENSSNSQEIPIADVSQQKQFRIERSAALWALDQGCEITIRLPNGKRLPLINQIESLPDQDFYITQIKFTQPQHLTQESLNHLEGLSTLQILLLDDCSLDEDSLEPLKNLITLQKLDLHNTGITDKGLSCVRTLKNLVNISLQNNQKLTDEGLQALNQLHHLKSANLARVNISDKGLNFIQSNPHLDWLNISETKVTDESVKHLITLKLLKSLYVRDSSITDEGMEEIRNMYQEWDPIKFD